MCNGLSRLQINELFTSDDNILVFKILASCIYIPNIKYDVNYSTFSVWEMIICIIIK